MEHWTSTDPQEVSTYENLPEGIGQAEDSGFASIAPVESAQDDEKTKLEEINRKILQQREERAAARRAVQEQYNEEKRKKAYKRLLHLVTQSKFYSDFLVKKLNSKDPTSNERGNRKRRAVDDVSAVPGAKKIKNDKSKINKKLEVILPPEIKTRAQKNGKLNLSQEDIETELNAVIPNEEAEASSEVEAFVSPKYFIGELRDYQQDGLKWLKALYENGMSGILADEMGLGKTIQVIAMIAHLIEKKQAGPYLIIAPLSTIPNWLIEFERFAPKIPVLLYYGSKNERVPLAKKIKEVMSVDNFKTQPVVLTTYEVPLTDKRIMRLENWRYLVIDEGQRIKNPDAQLSKVLQSFKSMSRLLLTGTPLQNNLKELWALLNFLMPDIFDDLAVFESWFSFEDFQDDAGTNRFLKQEEDKNVLQSLREILKPFMLRRMKNDVCLEIPPKKEVMVYCPRTELQHDLYTAALRIDEDILFKRHSDPLIIDDEFGKRPPRKCTYVNKYSKCYRNPSDPTTHQSTSLSSLSSSTSLSSTNSTIPTLDIDAVETIQSLAEIQKQMAAHEDRSIISSEVNKYKKYVNVTENNEYYLFRLSFGNRMVMYRKIVNHPYLLHLPLNDVGLPKVDDDLITKSGKLIVLDQMLKKLNKDGHRVLLFSTLKIILDLIEDYLSMRPWKYLRLDGEVKIEDRKESIQLFNNNPDYFLFLITTRAGGVGLNLAGADTVIIFDSDWNPQADIQAMARCHRIGQNKPVVIYRLCTKGTYDEAIVSRAEAKRKLEKLVISKEIDDLKFNKDGFMKLKKLLESTEHEVVHSEQEVFTEGELNKILDRSDLIARMKNVKETKKKFNLKN